MTRLQNLNSSNNSARITWKMTSHTPKENFDIAYV